MDVSGEYSVYNFSPWEEAVKNKYSIANSKEREKQFFGVTTLERKLVGFFRVDIQEGNQLEIGLGMAPEFCGKGLGKQFVEETTEYLKFKYPKYVLYMEVRIHNQRAISCYQSAGYKIVYRHIKETPWGTFEYDHMEYEALK